MPTTGGTTSSTTSGIAETSAGTLSTGAADTGASDGGFIRPSPDLGMVPRSCVPTQQDCPSGTKCVWYSLAGMPRRDAAQCIPVTGDRAPFEPCSLPNGIGVDIEDDCDASSYCLEVYGTADHGFCAPFSTGTCEAYEGTAAVFENGSDFPAACLIHPCNLLENNCPDGMRCMFYPASLYADTVCWFEPEPADVPVGAACDFGGCGEGRMCVPADLLPACEHERCCAELCASPDGSCQTPETACEELPLWGAGQPGMENVGACLLPGIFD